MGTKKVLVIDNIDSFVWNLVQYVGTLGYKVKLVDNKITLEEIKKIDPDRIIISPGPKTPKEAGNCIKIIQEVEIPILGVCLGHQCIVEAFGGEVGRADRVMHGKASLIEHDGEGIFKDIPNPFYGGRYHSLIAKEVPKELKITAKSLDDNYVMGVRHKKLPIEGVQFHPESILTESNKLKFPDLGLKLIKNFVENEY
ncbi:glutamine amidotransferase of anthranilate synthase [Methanocaldococcus sp. FS406-22]|uniref:anthranilate synthase component II n=1 Tax=Methanocaldococcus sp. (strain FS406-22) TaxID=644281 RepID=UPI0001BF2F7D|nr:aminodeoxychorismate/anthranilate synthase component II [Methanocaldococcus sp. FS406-22]ADC70482.1 glutamine amidotransferase of anthranilate synthase [Methanocaldococcus sp. FS406-22]